MPQFQRRVAAAVQRRPLAATANQTCQPSPRTGGSPSRRRTPGEEHGRTGEEGPGADGGGRATLGHEPLINEDPTEGNDERGDDEEVAADVSSTDGAVAGAENDKGDAGGGGKEREPAFEVEALVGKDASAHGEDDGHGADHEGGVGDGGEPESLELQDELDGNAEEGSDEEQPPLTGGEARRLDDRKQADAGEDEAVEDVVADAETGESDFAEEEAGGPAASSERAGDVARGATDVAAVAG